MGFVRRFLKARQERKERARLAHEQEKEAFRQRQLNPRFELIEEYYGKPISPSLRALYEDKVEIQREFITKIIRGKPEDDGIFVCWYDPLDRKHLGEQWEKSGTHFEFADDGSGSKWIVDPTDYRAIISFYEHETREVFPTGVLMSEFRTLEDCESEPD